MEILASFSELFSLIAQLFSNGGWIFFVIAGVYFLWLLFVLENQKKYGDSLTWINLAIDVPKENEQTFLAVEQIFAHMHSIHVNHTFGEKYFHGKVVLWVSFEMVSFGGQVKYIARLPEQFRNLLESAIYAQYPDAEITEVEDYLKNLPPYDPKTSYYNVWGTQLILKKDNAYPIRTYRFFEHQASQIIVDPLAGILEALASIEPHELMAVQILLRPTNEDWKEKCKLLVKKLKGEKDEKKKKSMLSDISSSVLDGLTGIATSQIPSPTVSASVSEYEPPSKMMHLSQGEKDIISSIEMKLGKIGYLTKIRLVYIAPKEKFRKDAKATIVGCWRQFDDINLNGLKPDMRKTWTGIPYKFSEKLETPFLDFLVNRRKQKLVRFFKSRGFTKGQKPFVLNIEELATIFHFPLTETVKTPSVTKTEIKKKEAPLNLPIQY